MPGSTGTVGLKLIEDGSPAIAVGQCCRPAADVQIGIDTDVQFVEIRPGRPAAGQGHDSPGGVVLAAYPDQRQLAAGLGDLAGLVHHALAVPLAHDHLVHLAQGHVVAGQLLHFQFGALALADVLQHGHQQLHAALVVAHGLDVDGGVGYRAALADQAFLHAVAVRFAAQDSGDGFLFGWPVVGVSDL